MIRKHHKVLIGAGIGAIVGYWLYGQNTPADNVLIVIPNAIGQPSLNPVLYAVQGAAVGGLVANFL